MQYITSGGIMSNDARAKVFWTGRSQAVRLPKEFRFDVEELSIRRVGSAVILEPIEKAKWPEGFWEEFDRLPDVPEDFRLPERPAPSSAQAYRDEVIEGWARSTEEP
jgi:antitoxin VapB